MLVRHTGRSPERIAADIERDKIFDAPAAVEYGLIDGIIASRKASRTAPGARVSGRCCPPNFPRCPHSPVPRPS